MRRKAATEAEIKAYLRLLDALRRGKDNQIKVTQITKQNDKKARN